MNTMLKGVTFLLKTMMKNSVVVLHKNPESGCSCCGGSLKELSLKQLNDLALDVDAVGDEVVQFTLDETHLYGVRIQYESSDIDGFVMNSDECDRRRYNSPNYLCKHLTNTLLYGDMLVFNDEEFAKEYHEMCQDYIRYG